MALKPGQSKLIRLKLLLAYAIYCCLSDTLPNQSPGSASSGSQFAQALVYHKYQPTAAPTPLLSRVNRQPANISASDSYYHNYQVQAHNRQQHQQQQQQQPLKQQPHTSYLTASGELSDELGQDSYGCPVECHCNEIAHIADCSDRNLTRVPARFPKDIKRIRLERNNITEIGPYAFQGLKRLQRIDLSNNNLYKIDALSFSGGMQALNTLILFNNKLQHLPVNVFSELSNLQILLLNANSLQTIHRDLFQSLTNLYLLSLYDNNIVSLVNGTFDALKSVKTIHLGKNPLNCDCNLRWLVDYFEANPTVETSEARCEQPTRSQGRKLSQLNKNELRCQEPLAVPSKSPNGDQSAGASSCPAGCICTGSMVDCSRASSAASRSESPATGGGGGDIFEVPNVPDDLPVYVARVHINDNRIKRIRETGLFKKLANSQKLDLGNNKIVDIEDNAINGRLPNGQKPERVIFVLLENQHCENNINNSTTRRTSGTGSASSSKLDTRTTGQQHLDTLNDDTHPACAKAPMVNEPQYDSPCYNGGTCRPISPNDPASGNFTCQCPSGFGGPLCELNIDDCVDHQCQNGAMCVDGINSYKCICRDPTTSGEFCEQLNSNTNNNLLFNSMAPFGVPYGPTSGASSNSIAPLALPIIAQANNGPVSQSNELAAGAPVEQQQQQQQRRSHQPQILERSADFLRQPDDLASNSLQQSSNSNNKNEPWKACHRATTSRYFDDGNGCQSVRLLKISECTGSCEQPKSAGGEAGGCCVPTKIKRRRIHMQCSDGASYVKVIDLVKKCSCSLEAGSCPAANNEPLAQVVQGPRQLTTPASKIRGSPVQTSGRSLPNKQHYKYSTVAVVATDQQAPQPVSQTGHQMGQSQSSSIRGSQEDQMLQIGRLDAIE